ncbi:MAG: hypothetical protein PHW73_00660 [Atribacterota bacterium]|nr:hypothetical protein [Atribacterota bacterium]
MNGSRVKIGFCGVCSPGDEGSLVRGCDLLTGRRSGGGREVFGWYPERGVFRSGYVVGYDFLSGRVDPPGRF